MQLFIVLRKHNKQLSFLHCYHHFMMVCAIYLGIMWVPGGSAILLGVFNSFVHVFMYGYYFATAFNPKLNDSSFYKKNITQIQLVSWLFWMLNFLLIFKFKFSVPILSFMPFIYSFNTCKKLRVPDDSFVHPFISKCIHALSVFKVLCKNILKEEN